MRAVTAVLPLPNSLSRLGVEGSPRTEGNPAVENVVCPPSEEYDDGKLPGTNGSFPRSFRVEEVEDDLLIALEENFDRGDLRAI
mmetsp:Transcript_13484/g.24180  ORF Transcript_13484/g.24180 Transcript_13484/m.24180 type:complete len:84 (+) Transcript_13484:442-693(+)